MAHNSRIPHPKGDRYVEMHLWLIRAVGKSAAAVIGQIDFLDRGTPGMYVTKARLRADLEGLVAGNLVDKAVNDLELMGWLTGRQHTTLNPKAGNLKTVREYTLNPQAIADWLDGKPISTETVKSISTELVKPDSTELGPEAGPMLGPERRPILGKCSSLSIKEETQTQEACVLDIRECITSDDMMYRGLLIATRQDYLKRIKADSSSKHITEDQAWEDIQKELQEIIEKASREKITTARAVQRGKRFN